VRPLATPVGLLSLLAFVELEACRSHADGNPEPDTASSTGGAGGAPESSTSNSGGSAVASTGDAGAGGADEDAGAGGTDANAPAPCPTFDPESDDALGPELLHPADRYEIYVLGTVEGLVYFIEGETLRRIPVEGGVAEIVGPWAGSWVRLIGEDALLWARPSSSGDTQQIVRAPLTDPEDISIVVESTPYVQHVVLDDTHVFWATATPPDVFRAPLAGAEPELLVAGAQPLGAVLHDGYYYWIDAVSDQLERVPVAGGAREELARVLFGGPMAASAGTIFWGDNVLSTIEKWSPDAGRVQLAAAIDPLQLQVWEGTLFWSQGLLAGAVRSVGVDGDDPRDVLCRLRPRTSFHVMDDHLLIGGGSGLLRLSR